MLSEQPTTASSKHPSKTPSIQPLYEPSSQFSQTQSPLNPSLKQLLSSQPSKIPLINATAPSRHPTLDPAVHPEMPQNDSEHSV
eukprot:gene31505-40913_t